jgi:hypothetical protein
MSGYMKRSERSQINDLMLYPKLHQKKNRQILPPQNMREIIKIRAKMNEIETNKKTHTRINESESLFFEKINKIDRTLANLSKMKRVTQIRMQKGR